MNQSSPLDLGIASVRNESSLASQAFTYLHVEGDKECGLLAPCWWQDGDIFLPDVESRALVLHFLADRILPKRLAILNL
jgi:hypothetical protein